jgi:hypothetical protein
VVSGPDAGTADAKVSQENPMQLARTQSARCIVSDANNLYWQNANGLVVAVAKTGGEPQAAAINTPTASNPRCGLAHDATSLFATSYEYGRIIRIGLEAREGRIFSGSVQFFGKLDTPSSITTDKDFLYVTEYQRGAIVKIAKQGGSPQVVELVSGLLRPDSIASDETNLYWINRGTLGGDAGDGGGGATPDGSIMRMEKSGGVPTVLMRGVVSPGALALAGNRLFWTSEDRTLHGIDTDGSRYVVRSSVSGPTAIAADKTAVLFAAGGIRSFSPLPDARDSARLLYNAQYVTSLTMDDARVYWSTGDEVWTGLRSE